MASSSPLSRSKHGFQPIRAKRAVSASSTAGSSAGSGRGSTRMRSARPVFAPIISTMPLSSAPIPDPILTGPSRSLSRVRQKRRQHPQHADNPAPGRAVTRRVFTAQERRNHRGDQTLGARLDHRGKIPVPMLESPTVRTRQRALSARHACRYRKEWWEQAVYLTPYNGHDSNHIRHRYLP